MTPEEKRKKIDEFIVRLSLMRDEACKLGLTLTMHKIKEASRQVGWELGNLIIQGKVDKESTMGM